MKPFLSTALISVLLAFGLTGCNSLSNLLSKLPANSFDKIQVGVTVGPYSHLTTLIGGEKQSDGSLKIREATGSTLFMGWGSSADIVNLTITPATPALQIATPVLQPTLGVQPLTK